MAAYGSLKILGDTELEVMQIVWARGRATIREVHEAQRIARPIAYTTTQTIMLRLTEKGILHQQPGTHYPATYSAAYSKDELNVQAVHTIVGDLHPTQSERQQALAALTWGLRG
jgi:BlaI family transcriptional regulator, penicillinase repressor